MDLPETSSVDYLIVDFSAGDKENVCQICGATPAGNHFNVISCRPCSAFFRRTVVLQRNFTCKLRGNCPINKNIRSICSHCRFKKCIFLGMNTHNINVNYDKASPKISQTSLTAAPKISPTPVMDKMIEGYRLFDEESRKLFFVCNPEELFSSEEEMFKPDTIYENLVYHRSQSVYILEMAMNYYPDFKDIETEARKLIFRSYSFRFARLRVFHLNTMYFVDNANRVVTHFGRYVDRHKHDIFFRTEIDPKESERMLMPIQRHVFSTVSKFRKLRVDEFEVVALSGLIMWMEANQFFGDSRYIMNSDHLLAELSWYEKNKHGEKKGAVRMGQICSILRNIEELVLVMKVARHFKMFLTKFGDPGFLEMQRQKMRNAH
ncbi:unnamed protein product [Bursaphelenchus xylophilus]|uniref:(pine wood nematode) hypothetical protein n=1 Tax=Bursaphelenchus xylophilus TaxID=6326 RepID=A0A1I7S4P6_BURXY|nr:unnamed protein product [Bursaphelenchus xylophilus]CAG9117279.1 unnamed protein product [Bursaphelenchus xylophilus]